MNQDKKVNMNVRFSQIITIKSAICLLQPNKLQLLAVSNIEACLFRIDEHECDDLNYLYEGGDSC
jgi:hypothetical protein